MSSHSWLHATLTTVSLFSPLHLGGTGTDQARSSYIIHRHIPSTPSPSHLLGRLSSFRCRLAYENSCTAPERGWATRAQSMFPYRPVCCLYHSTVLCSPSSHDTISRQPNCLRASLFTVYRKSGKRESSGYQGRDAGTLASIGTAEGPEQPPASVMSAMPYLLGTRISDNLPLKARSSTNCSIFSSSFPWPISRIRSLATSMFAFSWVPPML